MSGHSKWATTKHKKAVIDARRAKSWAKLIKNIEVAAKLGGPDLQGNPTLFDAVLKAKKTSVPKDNIDRAIKRGAGIGGESVEYASNELSGTSSGRCEWMPQWRSSPPDFQASSSTSRSLSWRHSPASSVHASDALRSASGRRRVHW